MRLSVMLADAAQASEGKVHALGLGWNLTVELGAPSAVVGVLVLSPEELGSHEIRFALHRADGSEVLTDSGQQVSVVANVDAHLKDGAEPDDDASQPLTFTLPPWPWGIGRFEWRVTVDGVGREDWLLRFRVAPRQST